MNEAYRQLIQGQAAKAVAIAESTQAIGHSGLKGELREIVIHDLLRPLLPFNFGLGRGQVVSAYQQISPQMDVIGFDNRVVPPILFERQSGLVPIEATLFTVEVKSKLNAGELKKSHDAAQALSKFRYAPPVGKDNHEEGHEIEGSISYLIAFATDLKRVSEIERYEKLMCGELPSLRGICVVGKGFWFWHRLKGWVNWDFPWKFGEVGAFVAAIINRCQETALTRRQPDLLEYLLWTHSDDVSSL